MKTIFSITLLATLAAGQAVAQSCTTQTTGVAFGSYQPLSGASATTAGSISVTCNPALVSLLVSYTVSIGPGTSGSIAARSMTGPGGRLRYQLYSDSLYGSVWGDGTGGSTTVTDGYLLGVAIGVMKSYPVYGQIPGGTPAAIGTYSDTVIVTLSY